MSMQVRVITRPSISVGNTESRLMVDEDGDIWIQLVDGEEDTIGYLLIGENSDGFVCDPNEVEDEWALEPFHGTIEITQ